MEGDSSIKMKARPRFRSVKYSVSLRRNETIPPKECPNLLRSKDESIINSQKFTSAMNFKRIHHDHLLTRQSSPRPRKDNSYLKMFSSFMNQDYLLDRGDQNKQNQVRKTVIIHQYDQKFECNSSFFTFFDVMAKPVAFIQNTLDASFTELNSQKNDMRILRGELNSLSKSSCQKIELLQNQMKSKFNQLKKMIGKHQIEENEKRLRHRKQIELLQRSKNLNNAIVLSLKQRNMQVQQRIFACHPLELQFVESLTLQSTQPQYL